MDADERRKFFDLGRREILPREIECCSPTYIVHAPRDGSADAGRITKMEHSAGNCRSQIKPRRRFPKFLALQSRGRLANPRCKGI